MKLLKRYAFRLLIKVVSLFFHKRRITGAGNVVRDEPAVFVSNHLGSYAPVIMTLFFPFDFRPWVTYQIVTRGVCTNYLETHFTKTEMRLRRPWSRWAAEIITPFCIALVRATGAIPVFGSSRRIEKTFRCSADGLINGDNLLIFPENEERSYSAFMHDLDSGFIHLGEIYYQRTGKVLNFYPVCVTKTRKSISIGKPITFRADRPYEPEKERVKAALQTAIERMAR